jgi:phosphate transport system ATP-binding protein
MTSTPVLETKNLDLYYSAFKAVHDVSLPFFRQRVTALIGPSGCGKSTLLRTLNRMNDFIPGFRAVGTVEYNGSDIYAAGVAPEYVRKRIGMVFQKPNPFPSSIFRNIAWAPQTHGYKGNISELVEKSLVRVGLWDEVKNKLNDSGLALSGGQQQRLCIARAIAMEPDVILMDEPCSALDPKSTLKVEDLIRELKESFSIAIVTHNMQQAYRISDHTAFMYQGEMIEFGLTEQIFKAPVKNLTKEYISGAFG